MEKLLFAELPESQRREHLDANAHGVEVMNYTMPMSQDELAERKDKFTQLSLELSRLAEEKKEFMETHKATVKPVAEEHKEVLEEIRMKSFRVHGECFRLVDPNEKKTGFYDPRGQLIYERSSTPEELSTPTLQMKARKVS